MHARPDELLSLRDDELRERLRALPMVPPDAGAGWASVQARLQRRGRSLRRRTAASRVAAAASVAALGLFAALKVLEPLPSADRQAPEPAAVADLRARSQALEAVLAALPERPAVARADTSFPIDSLESQVQWLDHQLSVAGSQLPAPQAEQLWRDRVEVMNSLVQLRYVEAQRPVL